jgi:hypothetical protein
MVTGSKVMKNVEKEAELVPPVAEVRTDVEVPLSLAEPTLGSLAVSYIMVVSSGPWLGVDMEAR